MSILLAVVVTGVAVVAWTAWEARMTARLRRDTRPLVARHAAVAGAQRLSTVGQVALVALAVAVAAVTQVSVWWSPVAVAAPVLGGAATAVLVLAAVAAVVWAGRRGRAPRERRALAAAVATAVATELLLRGLLLALLDAAGWSVTVAVLLAAVATGLLQAWRGTPGGRAVGFVLATLLGVGLGLVVVLTGSVVAAAATHVLVVTLGLARTIPVSPVAAAGTVGGCACGQDHRAAGPKDGTAPAGAGATGGADHTGCGSTCDHAGTSACATCPLSTARV